MDAETEKAVKARIGPVLGTLGAELIVGGVAALILKLVALNMKTSAMTGDTEMHPTKSDVSLSKTEASAKDNDASLAKDQVKAKDGDLSAAQTDAKALTSDAKALDSGASAAQPKAGALDVKNKGIVMS
jgi:gamma-glutamyltranspeptidase